MILLNGAEIKITTFPNGESVIDKIQIGKYKKDTGNEVTLIYQSDADLMQLLFIRKAIWFDCNLVLPYMPYSRMDRKSDSYIFTLKSLAKYLNFLDFKRITIYEPHSDVTNAVLNRSDIKMLVPNLLKQTDFDNEKDCVLYPDTGAYKKYSDLIKAKNELIGIKKRDFTTGRIKDLQIVGSGLIEGEELARARVFIVDDLCSKGGTFILSAEQLLKMGAGDIFLVVAHCEETIKEGKIFTTDLIKKVFTTDTMMGPGFYSPNPRLQVFHYKNI